MVTVAERNDSALIKNINALEILDSRGNPTLGVRVECDNGIYGYACVPSGASTGSFEAVEKRDGGKRYLGKGVMQAVQTVNQEINTLLSGVNVCEQALIDNKMCAVDGTDNKSRLGANALLGVSLAVAHAAAAHRQIPLYRYIASLHQQKLLCMPMPMMNILNGGSHASNNIDIQEFMVRPLTAPNFAEGLRWGVEIYHALRALLLQKNHSVAVGDEGGFAPDLPSNRAALDILVKAVESAGFKLGSEVDFALDCAASELYKDSVYHLQSENKVCDSLAFVNYLSDLCADYPIGSLEDGLAEDDWKGWALLSEHLRDKTQLVGDDIFVTNPQRLGRGIKEGIANSILIKPNQIGTLSETLEVLKMASVAGYTAVISHRSGETEDTTIADLAVGSGAGQIKTGAPCRSERVAKYNRLLFIESETTLAYGSAG